MLTIRSRFPQLNCRYLVPSDSTKGSDVYSALTFTLGFELDACEVD